MIIYIYNTYLEIHIYNTNLWIHYKYIITQISKYISNEIVIMNLKFKKRVWVGPELKRLPAIP